MTQHSVWTLAAAIASVALIFGSALPSFAAQSTSAGQRPAGQVDWSRKPLPLASGETDRGWPFHSGRIRVRLAVGADIASVAARHQLASPYRVFQPPFSPFAVAAGFDRAYRIPVPQGREKEFVRQLARFTASFEYVGLDYVDEGGLAFSPNDSLFVQGFQGNLDVINMRRAWDRTFSSSAITIAIIDGGLQGTHEDAAGKQFKGYDYRTRTYTSPGFTNNDDTVVGGKAGHGTRVATMAAAGTNNSIGISGAGFNSNMMAIKAFGSTGALIPGVQRGEPISQAAGDGALVINMSYAFTAQDPDENAALQTAWLSYGIASVAAAGNNGDQTATYPCAALYVICVANANNDGSRSPSSTYSTSFVDVAAPGENIYGGTNQSNSAYDFATGTSLAAPQVSGIMALMRACGYSPDTSANALFIKARPNTYTVWGLVDAGETLFHLGSNPC